MTTKGEEVLVPRLRAALERLNPALPPEAITAAVDELTRDRSAMSLPAANREIYSLIKDGIRVSIAQPEDSPSSPALLPGGEGGGSSSPHESRSRRRKETHSNGERGTRSAEQQTTSHMSAATGQGGGQRTERVRVIDWETPAANDFLLVSQFSVTGALYTCRPDLVGFVNGLPLVVIELKKPGVPARAAFDENLTHYKQQIPALFWFNALLIASNGTDSRVGSLTADWERFFEWKRIEREDEPRRVSLEVMLRGTCDRARLLDLVENFTLFSEHKAGLVKIVGQNHQFLGVNNAIASMLEARKLGHGRGGVFWQTQGSGKSFSMVFFAQKVLRKVAGNWTFVIATDRVELDDQIAKTFKATGAVSEAEGDQCHASSGAHLRELLRGNHRYVFTLIHKFQPEKIQAETPSSPALLPGGEGGSPLPLGEAGARVAQHYRGGLQYAGLVERARELRKHRTSAEAIAWELLRDRRFEGLKFRREHQINNYIADFFCAEHQIDIELDGEIHKSPEVMEKDAARDAMLRSLGFKVLRFPNQLVLEQPEEFLRQIAAALELPSTSGRGAGGEGHDEAMPVLSDRRDIVVLADEAHRSQYDTLALNMRAALPRAIFIAFTGTPLIAGEERTKDVFGGYVSIYDFQQSVEDGATVPLFYENRTPELQLVNPDLNDDIYNLIEAAELDPDQEAKLERELSKQYHILTRDDRLETVAQDIVRHFLGRGFIGKAMVVSIDKATALKMHNKVRKHWAAEQKRVEREIAKLSKYPVADDVRRLTSNQSESRHLDSYNPEKMRELQARLEVLKTTDMALIVSPGQNEIPQMKKLGLDIEPHRRRMNDSEPGLDEKFKDTADPLRLVFVCAMWLTGFDAPSCSTVYLDKPMRNHTLMQTIARANRVFPGKHSGMIVDYANVFASLEKALAIYGAGKGGANPVRDKAKLVEELRKACRDATAFCSARRVDLPAIEQLTAGCMERLHQMDDAVNALVSPDPLRREFLGHERLVGTLYGAVKPDVAALEFAGRVATLTAIAEAIRTKIHPDPVDITEVLGDISVLLDQSITGMTIKDQGPPALDLSKINFEELARRFKTSKHKNSDLEVLKAAIRAQLEKLIRLNKTRADFADKFEKLIESYNNGSRNIEELFAELVNLSRSLSEEQQRHVRENMTEEELVIFDILTRPAPELSAEERAEVKKVARMLLDRLNALLVLNWRQKSSARSQLKLAIEDVLDTGLPRAYDKPLYEQKCSLLFEHIFESYPERNAGVYQTAS
jgi:type I site-specific restriction-modification system R (restriction) subunit